MKTVTYSRTSMVVGGLLAFVACHDATAPVIQDESNLSLSYADGATYQATGEPAFEGGDLSSATFATAYPDSVGGYVISAFQQTDGSTGDLFILQLTDRQTGAHGPCGTGADCHGRILEDFDAATLQLGGTYWEITSGTVQVDQSGPDRLSGSFSDLVLEAQNSSEPDRTIQSGTFDLKLLSDEEGKAAMGCFLASATGSGSC